MKMKFLGSSALAMVLLAGCASEKQEQAKLQAQAKVSRADTEQTALTQAPLGTIKEGELEKEHGKLIWSFDIAMPDAKDITEVAVDALTGDVVSVAKETPKQEATENDKDAKKGGKDKD